MKVNLRDLVARVLDRVDDVIDLHHPDYQTFEAFWAGKDNTDEDVLLLAYDVLFNPNTKD